MYKYIYIYIQYTVILKYIIYNHIFLHAEYIQQFTQIQAYWESLCSIRIWQHSDIPSYWHPCVCVCSSNLPGEPLLVRETVPPDAAGGEKFEFWRVPLVISEHRNLKCIDRVLKKPWFLSQYRCFLVYSNATCINTSQGEFALPQPQMDVESFAIFIIHLSGEFASPWVAGSFSLPCQSSWWSPELSVLIVFF